MRGSILVKYNETPDTRGLSNFEVLVNTIVRDLHFTDINNYYSTFMFVGDVVRFNLVFPGGLFPNLTIYREDYTTDDEGGDNGIKETSIPFTIFSTTAQSLSVQFTGTTVSEAYNFKYIIDCSTGPLPTFYTWSLGYDVSNATNACNDYATSPSTYYTTVPTLQNGIYLYDSNTIFDLAPAGYYSNGSNVWFKSASTLTLTNQSPCATPTPTPTTTPTPTPTSTPPSPETVGKYVYVGDVRGVAPKYSSDFGVTYSASTLPPYAFNGAFTDINCSRDGQYVIYGVEYYYDGSRYRYQFPKYSTNYGVNLSNIDTGNTGSWPRVAISKTGAYGLTLSTVTSSPSQGIVNRVVKISNYFANDVEDTFGGFLNPGNISRPPVVPLISETGQYQIVLGYFNGGAQNGELWWATSSNSGSTFTVYTGSTDLGIPIYGSISDSGQYSIATYTNFGSGIFRSTDYGVTYTKQQFSILNVVGNTAMSSNGQYVYIKGINLFYKSTDYGATFTQINFADIGYIRCSEDGSKVFVLSNNQIYKSTDYGNTFSLISSVNGNNFAISYIL